MWLLAYEFSWEQIEQKATRLSWALPLNKELRVKKRIYIKEYIKEYI